MSEPTPLEQSQRALAAVTLLYKGYSRDEVIAELGGKGISETEARAIVDSLPPIKPKDERQPIQWHKPSPYEDYSDEIARRARERRAALVGGGMCLLGILLTVLSYGSAVGKGGGQYAIYFGLILGGVAYAYRELNRN